ncbi:MAG: DUF1254 domain-containing protein [Parvibaculum sp.]|uniref:DUF1254 domain-containing protein n=1 Tax=Parvibaculum sp. TaxID=2024848 RepID=UPI0025EE4D62|nr:DUF1254 domain-containing protein [Parvibaculum sp.]MCE9649614.1 DUF1254 domain-containing protein [Parvibaculum sp.]
MKRAITFIAATLVLAAVVHVASVWAVPRLIMSVAMKKISGNGAVNAFINPPLSTAAVRAVVRPSPDLAYSICILDLSNGPVRIEVPLTAPYTSLALYTTATDNYFVRNDRGAEGKTADILVIAPGAEKPAAPAGSEIVEAPTARGLVVVRRVVESKEAFAGVDAIRKQSACAPFQG